MTEPRGDKTLEVNREWFIGRLIAAGWSRDEAEVEWEEIQQDEEGIP